jgi:hypothetical protein
LAYRLETIIEYRSDAAAMTKDRDTPVERNDFGTDKPSLRISKGAS